MKNFNIKENELKLKLQDIEESNLILSQDQINLQIDDYNKQLSEFTNLIEEFNFHYQNQIIIIREYVFKEIIKLIEKYAIENSVDLILDSGSYLIASNELDITGDINSELDKLNLNLEFKDFEKIKYIEIKEKLEKHSLEVTSEISEDEYFLNLKTIANSSTNDLSFFSNIRYLNDLKKIKAKACLIEEKFIADLPASCNPIIVKILI